MADGYDMGHERCLMEVLAGLPVSGPVPSLAIASLTLDSRKVSPGAAFVALPGAGGTHGLHHVAEALQKGAVVILYDPQNAPTEYTAPSAGLAIPRLEEYVGQLARNFYFAHRPQPMLLGVTGTSGKTTTAFLATQLLDGWQDGRCAYLGTVGHGFPESLGHSTMTTPDVLTLHRQLASLGDAGATMVVCEVSSHALDQHRLDGLEVAVAAFANLGRDHLDYHGDMQGYASAKARLFGRGELKTVVANGNDPWAAFMLQRAPASSQRLICCLGGETARPGLVWLQDEAAMCLVAQGLQYVPGLRLALTGPWGNGVVDARHLWGACNAANLLLAMGMALAAGRPLAEVLAAAHEARLPPGRFETFERADGVVVVVDYAHKPEALEAALGACRSRAVGRLLCVFGCGGNRDQGKRPLMGAVAAAGADVVWLTDDNPRHEDPGAITDAIEAGLGGKGVPYRVCHDRARAIAQAIAAAEPGDVVLVAGKGHEVTQERCGTSHAFDDRAVVRACLAGEGAMA